MRIEDNGEKIQYVLLDKETYFEDVKALSEINECESELYAYAVLKNSTQCLDYR